MKAEGAYGGTADPLYNSGLAHSSNASCQQAKRFEHQLRAVGQALEKFNLVAFDLENVGRTYVVNGRTTVENGKSSFSRRVRELLSTPFSTSDTTTAAQVVLRFSSEDIERFEVHGKTQRQDANQMPDPYNISQILRGVGAYIDHKKAANLVGISLNGKWVTTSYHTASQKLERVQENLEFYYGYWVNMYLERSNRSKPSHQSDPTVLAPENRGWN